MLHFLLSLAKPSVWRLSVAHLVLCFIAIGIFHWIMVELEINGREVWTTIFLSVWMCGAFETPRGFADDGRNVFCDSLNTTTWKYVLWHLSFLPHFSLFFFSSCTRKKKKKEKGISHLPCPLSVGSTRSLEKLIRSRTWGWETTLVSQAADSCPAMQCNFSLSSKRWSSFKG